MWEKKSYYPYNLFYTHKYISVCVSFLAKSAGEINTNHMHALSEIIFDILWTQIDDVVLE